MLDSIGNFILNGQSLVAAGFNSTFGLVEVNFGGSEKFRPNGLSLVHNGF